MTDPRDGKISRAPFFIHSSILFTKLKESRVIAMIATDAIIPMIARSLVVGPKVDSWLIICHVAGIREKPSTMAIIIPETIACNNLVCMFFLLLIVVCHVYSSIF
jgi:hypothetical protein